VSDELDQVDDVLEEIYEKPPEHSHASYRDFRPWHLPRKHWVRINQLCTLTRSLMRETKIQDGGKILRYLTLPGEDLLDIKAVEKTSKSQKSDTQKAESICEEGSEELLDVQSVAEVESVPFKVRYLGFNALGAAKDRLERQSLSESILKDLDTIDRGSRILNCAVQTIAQEDSIAYKAVFDEGPFNVINLDLCKSIAKRGAAYFDAIRCILDLQRQHMTQPFLLLLTTRTTRNGMDKDSLEKIKGVYKDNFSSGELFKKEFEQTISQEGSDLVDKITTDEAVSQDLLNRILGVGLGKWLLHLMKGGSPEWNVSLESIFSYGVGKEAGTMLSLAFRFELVYVQIEDKTGLSNPTPNSNVEKTEIELATQMLRASQSLQDVDSLLEGDPAAKEKITNQTARFLEKVGYSPTEFKKWIDEGAAQSPPTTPQ